MDCTKQYTVRVTEGNAFALILPLKSRHYISTKPIDSDIDILMLQNVVVKVGGVVWDDVTRTTQGVSIAIPATQAVGTYNVELTALYNNIAIRAAYFECFTIVPWSYQSDVQNFIPDSPITAEAAFIVAGNWTNEELDALTQELQQAIADNRAAQADAEAAKDEFVQKAAMLDNVAQQGSNPGATLTDTQAAVEALAPVAAAAEAYAEGKPALAQAITSKGVQTASTDSLATMAQKVSQISQDSYTIDGGELYAKQLFGSLTTPNYWNLYEVLESLLSDGRFVNYGGILLAEYYKGYDTLALSGAGAGGGYVTSDGQYYTEDTTHTWNDDLDGKGNRWVAYLFATAGHGFTISDTNTSPRSIFIGRHVGKITCLANTRISQIVVPDGNILDDFDSGSYTANWGAKAVLRNIGKASSKLINSVLESFYLKADEIEYDAYVGVMVTQGATAAIIEANKIHIKNSDCAVVNAKNVLATAIVKADTIVVDNSNCGIFRSDTRNTLIKSVHIITEECNCFALYANNLDFAGVYPNFSKIYVGYITNDKTRSVGVFHSAYNIDIAQVTDVELQQGWNKPFSVVSNYGKGFSSLTEANMYAHILQRLKQDEAGCGAGITISLGTANLARLTSAESVALLAELRGTYGYTFA